MRRSTTTVALALTTVLALGACGGGGDVEEAQADALSQEQTEQLLLTQDEFPIEGWTRGEPEPVETGDDADETAAEDSFDDLFAGTEGIPQECLDALERVGDMGSENVTAGSKVTFEGPDEASTLIPAEAELVVASFEGGASPLAQLAEVNEHCSDLEIEQDGMTMQLSFAELDGMDGTRMTLELAGIEVGIIMGGQSEGSTVVALMATGMEEADVKTVVDAQMAKVRDAG